MVSVSRNCTKRVRPAQRLHALPWVTSPFDAEHRRALSLLIRFKSKEAAYPCLRILQGRGCSDHPSAHSLSSRNRPPRPCNAQRVGTRATLSPATVELPHGDSRARLLFQSAKSKSDGPAFTMFRRRRLSYALLIFELLSFASKVFMKVRIVCATVSSPTAVLIIP